MKINFFVLSVFFFNNLVVAMERDLEKGLSEIEQLEQRNPQRGDVISFLEKLLPDFKRTDITIVLDTLEKNNKEKYSLLVQASADQSTRSLKSEVALIIFQAVTSGLQALLDSKGETLEEQQQAMKQTNSNNVKFRSALGGLAGALFFTGLFVGGKIC